MYHVYISGRSVLAVFSHTVPSDSELRQKYGPGYIRVLSDNLEALWFVTKGVDWGSEGVPAFENGPDGMSEMESLLRQCVGQRLA